VTVEELYAAVLQRAEQRPAGSGTVHWLDQGPDGLGRKLLEEAAEAWMAARHETREDLRLELSQVLYFVVCLMVSREVTLEEVLDLL